MAMKGQFRSAWFCPGNHHARQRDTAAPASAVTASPGEYQRHAAVARVMRMGRHHTQ